MSSFTDAKDLVAHLIAFTSVELKGEDGIQKMTQPVILSLCHVSGFC